MEAAIFTLRAHGIIKGQVLSYGSLQKARGACYEHSVTPMRIILGDWPKFWVVSPSDAERLVRAGYEPAF